MRSQPLPGEASRRRAEEQFKTTEKVNSETKANTPSRQAEAAKTARLRALRLAKEAADKDTANRGAAERRPGDLSRAGAFEALRPQPRQNPSKAQRDFCPPSRQVCGIIGEARRAAPGRDQSFRAGQYLQHARPRPKPCRDLLHAGPLHASRRGISPWQIAVPKGFKKWA